MNFFRKKKPKSQPESTDRKKEIKKTAKDANRSLGRSQRDVDKEIREMNRQEKDLTTKMKKAHSLGRHGEVKTLAQQIVKCRKTREQLQQTNGRLGAMKSQNTAMASSAVVMETMGMAGRTMSNMNQAIGTPQQMQQTMSQFMRETEKMSLVEESFAELMDDFDGDEIDTEADLLFNQVMDEAGLGVASTMQSAPVSRGAVGVKQQEQEQQRVVDEQELDEFLAGLTQNAA